MKHFTVVVTPRAIKEMQKTMEYYNGLQAGLGRRFHQDYKTQITSLKHNPFARAIRYADIRFAVFDNFPYAIHYNIEDNQVIILAVLSIFQNPETFWIEA